MKRLTTFAALLVCSPLVAADADLPELDKQMVTETVNQLCKCSGLYEVAADGHAELNSPARANYYRDTARGSRIAAAYLLWLEAGAAGKPKDFKELVKYIDVRATSDVSGMAALMEEGDQEAIRLEAAQCNAIMELQVALVQQVRDMMAGR